MQRGKSGTIRFPNNAPGSPGVKSTILSVLFVPVVILILYLFLSSWFTIGPEEVGVILRFGKFDRIVNPGLNFKLPLGMEKLYKVPVQRQLKQEFGFRTKKAGVRTQYSTSGSYLHESLMLTGDLNAAEVQWIVQYRIVDPYKYLFKIRNPEYTFRDINETVMREIIGDRTVNEVLTIGRQEIASSAKIKVQKLADQYETGIKVDQIVLKDVNPPEVVKPSFNEVNEAQQEKEKMINQAKSEYNKIIPKAKGEAERIIEEANGYALERVNNAKGEAMRFTEMFEQYKNAKEITKNRIFLETMAEVLPHLRRKIIIDSSTCGKIPQTLFIFNSDGKEKGRTE